MANWDRLVRKLSGNASVDQLLEGYLTCTDRDEANRLLTTIVDDHVKPDASRFLHRKTNSRQELDDCVQDSCIRAIQSLSRIRDIRLKNPKDPSGTITHIESLARIWAEQCWAHQMAEKYPEWRKLQRRLRYALEKSRGFAVWDVNGVKVCGLDGWQLGYARSQDSSRADRLRDDPEGVAPEAVAHGTPKSIGHAALAASLIVWLREPIALAALTSAVAAIMGINLRAASLDSSRSADREDDGYSGHDYIPDRSNAIEDSINVHAWLSETWRASLQWPLSERRSFWLFIKMDGDSVLQMLPRHQVAVNAEIAAKLDISLDLLDDIWNELPLSDKSIGHLFSISPEHSRVQRNRARRRLTEGLEEGLVYGWTDISTI